MGKVRKHKQKPARVDPVGLDSAIAELQHGMDQVEYFSDGLKVTGCFL